MPMDKLTIKDIKLVTNIICDPEVLFTAKDDGITDPYFFVRDSLHDSRNIWLNPAQGTLLLFKPINYIMAEMHIAINGNKSRSRESCIKASRWIFNNTTCEKLITYINKSHIIAISLACECGMTREGILKEAVKVNGINADLIVLGATKDKFNQLYGE